jgi:hypothetical protein
VRNSSIRLARRAIAGVCVLAVFPAAASADLVVTTTQDLAPDPAFPRCTADDCTLREAVMDANQDANTADTVVLGSQRYLLQIAEAGTDADGFLVMKTSMTIRGAGARATTIDASPMTTASRVLDFPDTTPTGSNSTISDLRVTGGDQGGDPGGGAIYSGAPGSSLNLVRLAIDNNSADEGGGVGMTALGGTMNIVDSTISANHATAPADGTGGGAYVDTGALNISNTTISGNTATIGGGGIYNSDQGAAVTLLNDTIAGNHSDAQGGGLQHQFASDATTFRNTIFAANTAPDGPNCKFNATGASSGGHNLEDGDTCALGAAGDKKNAAAKLGSLADNGGQTDTRAIATDSPAVNAGQDCPATDQRGNPRNGLRDIGAFEAVLPAGADVLAPAIGGASVTRRWRLDRRGKAEAQASAKRKKRKAARKGGTFKYTLSESARVVFKIEQKLKGRRVKRGKKRVCARPSRKNRKKRRCTRYKRFGSFAVASLAGKNTKKFSGRIGRRRIKPGSYRATLVATDAAGNRSTPRQLSFRVVRR